MKRKPKQLPIGEKAKDAPAQDVVPSSEGEEIALLEDLNLDDLEKPTPEEVRWGAEVAKREIQMRVRRFKLAEDGKKMEPSIEDKKDAGALLVFWGGIGKILGTVDGSIQMHLINQLPGLFWNTPLDDAANAALAHIENIAPKDSLEAMLAVQMLGTHNAAVEMLRRSLLPQQTFEGAEAGINRAAKLMRIFAAQMEALDRHRGKGSEQKVVVQHVNVSEGGQAIVGNVTKGPGGTGE